MSANPRRGSPTPVLYSVPDEDIAVSIDIAKYLDIKREAFRCHETQGGGGEILEVFDIEASEFFVAMPRVVEVRAVRCSDLFAKSGNG